MSWFKVDDKFHAAQEVKQLPRSIRAEAIGLWTLAGAWSADLLKDGFVPLFMVEELGGSFEAADALVTVKLWRKTKTGYWFRNWSKWQPTRAEVETNRKEERDRKAAYRAAKAEKPGAVPPVVPPGQNGNPGTPDPTRPDPTRPLNNSSTQGAEPKQAGARAADEQIQHGGKPVDNYAGALPIVAARLSRDGGREVTLGEAGVVVDWILSRAKSEPKSIRRYVLSSITRDWALWSRYITEGRLPE